MRARWGGWTVPVSAAALVVALGAWGGLRWSLIPVAVEGRIATVHYVSDNGYRLRELALTDGRSLIVDRDVVARFGSKDDLAGQSITKTAGDWSVQIGGKTLVEAVGGLLAGHDRPGGVGGRIPRPALGPHPTGGRRPHGTRLPVMRSRGRVQARPPGCAAVPAAPRRSAGRAKVGQDPTSPGQVGGRLTGGAADPPAPSSRLTLLAVASLLDGVTPA